MTRLTKSPKLAGRRGDVARPGRLAQLAGGALAFGMFASPALAADPWSLTLKAGPSYDSNVTISQIDTSTGLSDSLVNLDLSTAYKLVNTPTGDISVGYDFSQSLHTSLKAFDLQSHDLSLNGSVKIATSTLSAGYSFYHITLGGQSFLDMNVVNPGILTPLTTTVYLHASYLYMDERFLTDSSRDATHSQPEAQLFYFFDKSKAFFLLGANYQRETTTGPEFAYKGYAVKTSLTLPLRLFRGEGKIKGEVEWMNRDYDNITAAIGVKRHDQWTTANLSAEVPIIKKLSLGVEYSYIDRNSNLPVASYDENIVRTYLVYRY